MSISASLNISLASRGNQALSSVKIIESLSNNGWNLINNGKICYLPIGDQDDFDWQESQISKSDFLEVVKRKEQAGEIVGVVINWGNTNVGGDLLIHQDYKLTFSITVNRKSLEDSDLTDFNWYLGKILPCFEMDSMTVANFSFDQY